LQKSPEANQVIANELSGFSAKAGGWDLTERAVISDGKLHVKPDTNGRWTSLNKGTTFLALDLSVEIVTHGKGSGGGLVFISDPNLTDYFALYVTPDSGQFYVEQVIHNHHLYLIGPVRNFAVRKSELRATEQSYREPKNLLRVTGGPQIYEIWINNHEVYEF